jgi:hypothetical protein
MTPALLFILSLAMSALSAYGCWRDVSCGRCGWGFAMRAAFFCTVLAPQTVLYALLPSMDLHAPGFYGFVARALDCDAGAHLRLMLLTILCWAGMEIGYRGIMHRGAWDLKPADPADPRASRAERIVLVACWVLAIASVAVLAAHTESSSLGEMAGEIAVGMRMNWNAAGRGFLPAIAFAILGAMECQAAFGLFAGQPPRLMRSAVAACIALPALAATGSRRAFIVPVVVTLLTSLSLRRMRSVATLGILIVLLLAIVIPFGRSALRMMAHRDTPVSDASVRAEIRSDSLADQCGYVAVELSISQLESLSTMRRYEGPPLLGFDHWMAIARVVVKESVFGIQLPRITRQMTEMHTGDPNTNDVPAGFVGAAWADAGWLGFLVLPVMLGGVAAVFDRWAIHRRWTAGGRYCCFAAGYLLFFQTMNTGTLDYALAPESILVIGLCAYAMSRMPSVTQAGSAAFARTHAGRTNTTLDADTRIAPGRIV